MKQFVYSFAYGSRKEANLLGTKGANLAEMTRIGLPVPFGFVISAEAKSEYDEEQRTISEELASEILGGISEIETVTGREFGNEREPLLVSVRLSDAESGNQRGVVLNLGMNETTLEGLAALSGDPHFAYDAYRRFLVTYGGTVYGIEREAFKEVFRVQIGKWAKVETKNLTLVQIRMLTEAYQRLILEKTGSEVPWKPKEQLIAAVEALLEASERPEAIIVQAMVFGNLSQDSGVGIASSRNPLTGASEICGRFLPQAQGMDIRKTILQSPERERDEGEDIGVLLELFPELWEDLNRILDLLEKHYKDLQEIEFVVEQGKLYIVKTETADRTAAAALKIAVDMEREGLIDRKTALMRLSTAQIEEVLNRLVLEEGEYNLPEDFASIMRWSDDFRTLKVRVNADHRADAVLGIRFGAEGIGLYRTEGIWQTPSQRNALRSFLFPNSEEEREEARNVLLEKQLEDFRAVFEMTEDYPVAIRLIDSFPPPEPDSVFPGYRGCRISVLYPGITEIQAEAVIRAALETQREKGIEVILEIMVPLVGSAAEFAFVKKLITDTAERYLHETQEKLDYSVGAMIEVPRAALIADELAKSAEFFSFGTNDLTKATFGLFRDDTDVVLRKYQDLHVFEKNPFVTIDPDGVGRLIQMASELGKSVRPNLKLGLCGAQARDEESVEFCDKMGLNYISCSPLSVPAAKFTAACAAIRRQAEKESWQEK